MLASKSITATIAIRHHVNETGEWIDKETIHLPKSMARRFYEALKKMDPGLIARIEQ